MHVSEYIGSSRTRYFLLVLLFGPPKRFTSYACISPRRCRKCNKCIWIYSIAYLQLRVFLPLWHWNRITDHSMRPVERLRDSLYERKIVGVRAWRRTCRRSEHGEFIGEVHPLARANDKTAPRNVWWTRWNSRKTFLRNLWTCRKHTLILDTDNADNDTVASRDAILESYCIVVWSFYKDRDYRYIANYEDLNSNAHMTPTIIFIEYNV